MKKIKFFALAVMAMLSTNAFAQLASGGFKLAASAIAGKYEITALADDYTFASDGVVEIPATLPNTAGDDFQIVGIAANAFTTGTLDEDLRLKVKGLKINASIVYIGNAAFADLGNLASVTFGTESDASELAQIGDGAFAKDPMLKTISFANCPKLLYFTSDGKVKAGTNAYTTPFVSSATDVNEALTTITLNEGTIDFGVALKNVKNLETQNIKNTKIRTLVGEALSGNVKITALELPSKPFYDPETGEAKGSYAVVLADDALKNSKVATLTINGNVLDNGIGQLEGAELTSVTFKGKVGEGTNPAILNKAFLASTKLATVTFEDEVAAAAVAAGAFDKAGSAITITAPATIRLTVSATKAGATAFDQEAFVTAGSGADVAHDVSLTLASTVAADPNIYRCDWQKPAATPDKIYVECKEGDAYYYAKFYQTPDGDANWTNNNVIINRGKGDITVYSAYADGQTIYMDPLYSSKDKYVVLEGQAVIVKVKGTSTLLKSDDKGKYIECSAAAATDAVTMRYNSTPAIINDIKYNKKISNQAIKTEGGATKTAYAVAKISSNGFKWKAISYDGTFYLNDACYIFVDAAAAAVRVVWLDEEGNATAIQKVETKAAANGAIYNLRGEKVNAAYKGIVIKDGKKYIQK